MRRSASEAVVRTLRNPCRFLAPQRSTSRRQGAFQRPARCPAHAGVVHDGEGRGDSPLTSVAQAQPLCFDGQDRHRVPRRHEAGHPQQHASHLGRHFDGALGGLTLGAQLQCRRSGIGPDLPTHETDVSQRIDFMGLRAASPFCPRTSLRRIPQRLDCLSMPRTPKVMRGLQVHPELRRRVQGLRQQPRGVGRHAAPRHLAPRPQPQAQRLRHMRSGASPSVCLPRYTS